MARIKEGMDSLGFQTRWTQLEPKYGGGPLLNVMKGPPGWVMNPDGRSQLGQNARWFTIEKSLDRCQIVGTATRDTRGIIIDGDFDPYSADNRQGDDVFSGPQTGKDRTSTLYKIACEGDAEARQLITRVAQLFNDNGLPASIDGFGYYVGIKSWREVLDRESGQTVDLEGIPFGSATVGIGMVTGHDIEADGGTAPFPQGIVVRAMGSDNAILTLGLDPVLVGIPRF